MNKYFDANAVFSLFGKGYLELKKDLPVRPSEMGLLNIIVQTEGPHTPLMLAELLDVSKPMISAHIAVLEDKGYIIKECSPEDKRSFYVIPTDEAKKLVKTTAKTMSRYLREIETALGTERFDALVETLRDANQILKDKKGADL